MGAGGSEAACAVGGTAREGVRTTCLIGGAFRLAGRDDQLIDPTLQPPAPTVQPAASMELGHLDGPESAQRLQTKRQLLFAHPSSPVPHPDKLELKQPGIRPTILSAGISAGARLSAATERIQLEASACPAGPDCDHAEANEILWNHFGFLPYDPDLDLDTATYKPQPVSLHPLSRFWICPRIGLCHQGPLLSVTVLPRALHESALQTRETRPRAVLLLHAARRRPITRSAHLYAIKRGHSFRLFSPHSPSHSPSLPRARPHSLSITAVRVPLLPPRPSTSTPRYRTP